MPFQAVRVAESRQAAKYDGTNSADFNTAISDFSIVSETPTSLTFNSHGQTYTVARNGFIAWYQGQVTEVFQNQNDYDEVYAAIQAAADHVHDLVLTTGPAKPGEEA